MSPIQFALTIVPESWFDRFLLVAGAIAVLWLALEVFLIWRRQATNLTPVTRPKVSRRAQPDFLKVDHAARAAALGRADEFAAELDRRDAEEARAAAENHAQAPSRVASASRIASLAALFMSVFSLAAMIAGAVWQVQWIGVVMDRYSTVERLLAVLRAHPVAFAVSAVVITWHVVQFVRARRWRAAA